MNSEDSPLVELVPLVDLKLDQRNPRSISKRDFESLKRSIEKFGFLEPVVVNRRNMIVIGGHQRILAARALKLKDVPVVWVDLDDARAMALNVALNKIGGEFDENMLAELIVNLDEELAALTGFSDEELEKLQADPFDEDTGELVEPVVPKVPKYTTDQLRDFAKSYQPVVADSLIEFLDWLDRHGQ